MLDVNQKAVHKKFNSETWLGNKDHTNKLFEWTTFYRRNINAFVEHYMGISLHWYQIIWIYLLNLYPSIAIVAGRASAKSFIIAVFACAKCILYPNSKVVVASGTKKQASLIVTEKIQKELIPRSPNLKREILKIKTNQNDIEVIFKNGSSIVVVPATENARGYRSTVLILEEFRQIVKLIVDSVLKPFQVVRQSEFRDNPFYINNEELIEEPVNIYISSSWRTSHWMWKLIQGLLQNKFKDNSCCLLATDYSIALKHGIKTKKTLMGDRETFDQITWRIEYENEMLRENTNAFFTYSMLNQNQRLKPGQCFYPQRLIDTLSKKKSTSSLVKQPNEIRIVSCDFAFVDKKKNDNSVFSCIRLIPESTEHQRKNVDGNSIEVKQGYRRIVPYLEAVAGGDVDVQAIRIKQLFNDFDADYVVLDTRNGGILVYDRLAKILYDEDRDTEYQAWTCMNDENIAARIKVSGAKECVFAISATNKLNSDIATSMREILTSRKIDFLINYDDAVDYLGRKNSEYSSSPDAETMNFYERPFLETQALINEMISLEYERGEETGVIKVYETGSNTKDRYTSVSYGSYFAGLLERDLLSDSTEYEAGTFVN